VTQEVGGLQSVVRSQKELRRGYASVYRLWTTDFGLSLPDDITPLHPRLSPFPLSVECDLAA
jgi:hypothetical protein